MLFDLNFLYKYITRWLEHIQDLLPFSERVDSFYENEKDVTLEDVTLDD